MNGQMNGQTSARANAQTDDGGVPEASLPELTHQGLFRWLWAHVPETRPHLARLRAEAQAEVEAEAGVGAEVEAWGELGGDSAAAAVNPYGLLSEAFYWPVLAHALRTADTASLPRLGHVVEALVGSGDADVVDAAHLRVVTPLSDDPALWDAFAAYAGPLTRHAAGRHR